MNVTPPIAYPETPVERDRWILARRPQRTPLDPMRPYACFIEEEPSAAGEIVSVATVFLTNRECPWRCLMCDLWKNTLAEETPRGAIPAQLDYALAQLPRSRHIKLYNSGSFFDPHAIPPPEYPEIADRLAAFERVIVESHPSLIGDSCFRFRDSLTGRLEVAMGLETAHPQTLALLNKRMTLKQFAAAASRLRDHNIDLRVFILVRPPFMQETEALHWAERSIDFAFDCGATTATLIPTRSGNGALDELATTKDFAPPRLATVEAAASYGLSLQRGRVFVDLWDIHKLTSCAECAPLRIDRLRSMNVQQVAENMPRCATCGTAS
jgi:archaeosine synthase beta-subunit